MLLHEKLFIFDPRIIRETFMISSMCRLLCTGAILFNMGITCHSYGLSKTVTTTQTTFLFSKALGLYQMIISLLTSNNVSIQNDHCKKNDTATSPVNKLYHHRIYEENNDTHHQNQANLFVLLQLALYNNMGCIYSHFFMYEEMKQCHIALNQLLCQPILSCTNPTLYERRRMILSDEDIYFFTLNQVSMTMHKLSPAA
jgi:hypothetical protein